LSSIVGGKRGVIVPYQLVDNIGDVVIIKHITTPTMPDEKEGSADEVGITPF
jgi:sporulation protein YlmC with PRC-barrel domain